jgi:NRPS condensation-like uncharacterized protein
VSAAEPDGAPATLQSRLDRAAEDPREEPVAAGEDLSIQDPVALLRHLDESGHFHRDGPLGRVFHRGMVSLRENVETDSLHISVDGNHLSAHVDVVSPMAADGDGPSRYSVRQAAMHNVHGMAQDVIWLVRGRQGDHSCVLDCEWVSDGKDRSPALLDPKASTWSVQFEARVAGSLDEQRLRAAFAAALGTSDEEGVRLDVVSCDDQAGLQAARATLLSVGVGLVGRPPLRATLAHHPDGDVLMLNVNHAAADGPGVLQVLRAIARAYAGHVEDEPALDFLACRELPVRPGTPHASLAARTLKRAVNRVRDTLARPGHLADDGGREDATAYGFHTLALDAALTARITDLERAHSDRHALMAALQLAIGHWNREHDKPIHQVGVLVPADLRPDDWGEDVVGNFSVTARVSTGRLERRNAKSALKAVAAQNARNTRLRTGVALIDGLRRNGLLAMWAKQSLIVLQPLTGNHHVDAAMLCDLGRVDLPAFGDGEIREIWFSIPTRSPMCMCVGAAAVGERLHLTLRYPQRILGADAARRFGDVLVSQIERVAGQEI